MTAHDLGKFPSFRTAISDLPVASHYSRTQLLAESFGLAQKDRFEVFYAPFDYVNATARVMIVGVTPGWIQMETSFVAARAALDEGASDIEVLRRAKRVAAFSGSLRTNLVAMLDGIDLAAELGVGSAAELFEPQSEHLAQVTSMLRYPVFNRGRNYSGSPAVSKNPLLLEQLSPFEKELATLGSALTVPLGKSVAAVLQRLADEGSLDAGRVLFGFPHPSGANAHRARQFETNRDALTDTVHRWFETTR